VKEEDKGRTGNNVSPIPASEPVAVAKWSKFAEDGVVSFVSASFLRLRKV
jgi:hypothetical protein